MYCSFCFCSVQLILFVHSHATCNYSVFLKVSVLSCAMIIGCSYCGILFHFYAKVLISTVTVYFGLLRGETKQILFVL
jgi:hypothetical protein